jgi:hypothetical protein
MGSKNSFGVKIVNAGIYKREMDEVRDLHREGDPVKNRSRGTERSYGGICRNGWNYGGFLVERDGMRACVFL